MRSLAKHEADALNAAREFVNGIPPVFVPPPVGPSADAKSINDRIHAEDEARHARLRELRENFHPYLDTVIALEAEVLPEMLDYPLHPMGIMPRRISGRVPEPSRFTPFGNLFRCLSADPLGGCAKCIGRAKAAIRELESRTSAGHRPEDDAAGQGHGMIAIPDATMLFLEHIYEQPNRSAQTKALPAGAGNRDAINLAVARGWVKRVHFVTIQNIDDPDPIVEPPETFELTPQGIALVAERRLRTGPGRPKTPSASSQVGDVGESVQSEVIDGEEGTEAISGANLGEDNAAVLVRRKGRWAGQRDKTLIRGATEICKVLGKAGIPIGPKALRTAVNKTACPVTTRSQGRPFEADRGELCAWAADYLEIVGQRSSGFDSGSTEARLIDSKRRRRSDRKGKEITLEADGVGIKRRRSDRRTHGR